MTQYDGGGGVVGMLFPMEDLMRWLGGVVEKGVEALSGMSPF